MLRSKVAEEQKNQRAFKDNLTKAVRLPDIKDRKTAVFKEIKDSLAKRGLTLDITELENLAATVGTDLKLTDRQRELNKFLVQSTPEQINKVMDDLGAKLKKYEKLKASYDKEVSANGGQDIPDHEYHKVKKEHEETLQEITENVKDCQTIIGLGVAAMMNGMSEREEALRFRKIVAGVSMLIGGVCLLASLAAIPLAVSGALPLLLPFVATELSLVLGTLPLLPLEARARGNSNYVEAVEKSISKLEDTLASLKSMSKEQERG